MLHAIPGTSTPTQRVGLVARRGRYGGWHTTQATILTLQAILGYGARAKATRGRLEVFVDGKRAGVMETRAFLRRNKRPQFATQSGPMLVINGRLHPKFRFDFSGLTKLRNSEFL